MVFPIAGCMASSKPMACDQLSQKQQENIILFAVMMGKTQARHCL